MGSIESVRARLRSGLVIPACPLALDASRRLDVRRQRALVRYYAASGAGGIAVGVHTTQFAIRDPAVGLFRPVLELAAGVSPDPGWVRIAGVCGRTSQAIEEATFAAELGYDAALLSVAAVGDQSEPQIVDHCRAVAEILPLVGFYLQPAVGGRVLSFGFWRRFAEIENVVAVKIAPFNRYQTIDVVRALMEAGRDDVALYTGNDDHILLDLLTPFHFGTPERSWEQTMVGGILGQWAVWTKRAVELHRECRRIVETGAPVPPALLRTANELTDANAALFDAANSFGGCIAGLHEILRRQGLLEGTWCLDPAESLGPGQLQEIERVSRAYPHLNDDAFVAEHLDEWLRD